MNSKSGHKNWQVFRLNEICATRCGILALSRPYSSNEESIPYIKPKDIFFNTIISSNEYISSDFIRQSGVEIIPKESILLAVTGANAGNIALLGKDAIVNQHVFCATIQNSLAKPRFLYYYLYFKKHLLIKVSKYAVRGSQRSLQKLQIPLPSLQEQDEIIRYLDLHFNEINVSLDDTKAAINEIYREKQFVINKVFFLDLAGDDGRWKTSQLKDCGLIHAGITPNGSIKEYYGSDYPLFKPTDFRQKMRIEDAETYLSVKGLKLAGFIRANSLIICSSGTNLGTVKITNVDGGCSQQIISFTPGDKLLPEFVYFQMNSDYFKEQMIKHSKNSTINLSAFKNLAVAVTNLERQHSIVNKLNGEIGLLEKKESDLNKKLVSLNEEKYNFLSQAFPSSLLMRANVIAMIFISLADFLNIFDNFSAII